MRLRFWKRPRASDPSDPRKIDGFRLRYDDDSYLFAIASDGSRWEMAPGTRVARLRPPHTITLNCGATLLSEGIEGIEVDALLDYDQDRNLFFQTTSGEKWQIDPGAEFVSQGSGKLYPNVFGRLLEDGPVSSTPSVSGEGQ